MKIQRSQQVTLIVALASALALSACGKKEEPAPAAPPPAATPAPAPATPPPAAAPAPAPVAVASIDLGTAVDAGKKVTTPTTTFAASDKDIYASVSTTGTAPTASLVAKWTYQDGQLVNETTETLAPNGAAVTAFKISKADGWPAGNYKVDITLDGKPAMSKDFSVK